MEKQISQSALQPVRFGKQGEASQTATPQASPLARPEDLHDGASGAPREKHALTDTDLQHIVPAFRMG